MSAIPPRTPWFLALARRYARRRLGRGLDGFYVGGLEAARAVAARRPLILAANHVAWWDTFLLVTMDEALGTESYALMDADSMRRLPFFGRIGALPLDRSGATTTRAGLKDAAARLDRPGKALWIFPQGEQRPAHLRPLGFRRGVGLLAGMLPEAAVVPVSIQYSFREAPAPAAFAWLGTAIPASTLRTDELEHAVVEGLARIDAALTGVAEPLPALVPSRGRGADGGVGGRLLGGRGRDGAEEANENAGAARG